MRIDENQVWLLAKGFSMGIADIVPGVSGGTIALVIGVYDRLINSISAVNKDFFKLLIQLKIKDALKHIDINFLLPLLSGILLAIVSMSRIMHYFMNNYAIYTWSLFFGLMIASIIFVSITVKGMCSVKKLPFVLVGILSGYAIISIIPVETSNSYPLIFLSGSIAICAMILPGISGSFILLILGKYMFITSALKNPFVGDHILIILIFSSGCLVGILSFSKLLNFLLKTYHNPVMCILLGFMIGSMKKIWPWKEVLAEKVIRGKTYVLSEQSILPPQFDLETIIAFSLMILGLLMVFFIEKLNHK